MAESEDFLDCVSQALERLRTASSDRGHLLLASMIELAQAEAEDDRRTRALTAGRFSEFRQRRLTGASAGPSLGAARAATAKHRS